MRSVMLLATMVLVSQTVGCVSRAQAGLSNAPALGGPTAIDSRVHDAIANGPDSCGRRLDPGPLRYRIPPCPTVTRPAADPGIPSRAALVRPVVAPWVQYGTRWPCGLLPEAVDASLSKIAKVASSRVVLIPYECNASP